MRNAIIGSIAILAISAAPAFARGAKQTRTTQHLSDQQFVREAAKANMAEIEDKTISEGRFILTHEVERAEMVCVIGDDVREKFFVGEDPIGKTLKIRDLPMTVVGCEEKRGSMFGNSMDNNVYIPLTTWQRMFGRRQSLQVHGKASTREQFQKAIEEARVQLRNKHKLHGNDLDDFSMVDVEQVNNSVDQFTGAIAGVGRITRR